MGNVQHGACDGRCDKTDPGCTGHAPGEAAYSDRNTSPLASRSVSPAAVQGKAARAWLTRSTRLEPPLALLLLGVCPLWVATAKGEPDQ